MKRIESGRHAFDDYPRELSLRAEVCVIGAGAGGSAVAAALSDAGIEVAMLEEGRHYRPSDFSRDTTTTFRDLYQGRGMRSLRGNAVIPMPGGRGVGGSTLINSAICFRTPPEVMRAWREEHGCHLITPERFGRYFDRIWDTLGVTVQPVEIQRENNLVFKRGADRLGLDGAFMERSAPGCVGCGICQYGCPTGGKASVDRTFLTEALRGGRLGIYADCRVQGVETRGDRVVAVTGETLDPETLAPAGTVRVQADVFVLCGGPVGSPLFLLANGMASGEHCGRHLVIHPVVGMLARFPHEIRPWHGVTQGYFVDRWDRGYLLQTYTVTPDQYYLLLQGAPEDAMRVMADLAHIASAGALVHDEDSEGSVRNTPAGPDLFYHLGDGDRLRLLEALRLCARVFLAAGAHEVMPGRAGAPWIRTESEIDALIPDDVPASHLTLYASHPMGTCRMGADPATSVVDPEGRVWGWSNLRVADASVFPSSLGVNPQVTTMAMGLMVGEAVAAGR